MSGHVKHFLFLCLISLSYGKNVKKVSVKDVVQRIYNLTANSLTNADPKEKNDILQNIKTKLLKSSESLGPKAEKYVELIMKGIEIMAANNAPSTTAISVEEEVVALRDGNETVSARREANDRVTKMAAKILELAQKHYKRAKTDEQRKEIIGSIKRKVMQAAKQKHDMIHVKHAEIKSYTDLITRGMELMMEKIDKKKRRMIMEFVNNKVHDDEMEAMFENSEQRTNFLKDSDGKGEEDEGEVDAESNNIRANTAPTEIPVFSPATAFPCRDVLSQTCTDINFLGQFVCPEGRILLLEKLCDGNFDCTDGSDERICINEAAKRLHRAAGIMSRVETILLRKCFLEEDNSLLLKQNGVLHQVLQKQISFLDKYKDMNAEDNEDVNGFKQTMNEVVVVIGTLAVALDTSLCKRYMIQERAEKSARKYMPVVVEKDDYYVTPPNINLKNCNCFGAFCTNLTCPEGCKHVCWHRFNLGKWSCQAVDQTTAVSLDMVCDGKLDCYDESDEVGCNSGVNPAKFEANNIFQKVLDVLHTKIISKEYTSFKSKLLLFESSVKQLQKEAMRSRIDVLDIKSKRDQTFATLLVIYEDILEKASSQEHRGFDLEGAEFFLLNMNEQLMVALKHSHTGNDRIISADGCFCRDGQCAVMHCSKGCTRACSVETNLTQYACKGDQDVFVPIDKICDEKPDCPSEDDEVDCSKEVCRKHHVMLLRNSIRDAGDAHKGTSLGETLQSWKTKVSSKLKIAENTYRPTRSSFRDTIGDALSDLVASYAAAEGTRRSQRNAFDEFFALAQTVITAFKTCGQ